MFAACSRISASLRRLPASVCMTAVMLLCIPTATAAVSSAGDVSPVPPAAGGSFAGPFRIGNVDVGTMSITGGTAISHTGPAVLGDTVTGIGIANMSGFGSDWTLTSAGADMTIANNGTGSLNLSNLAFLSVNDDLFVASQLNSLGEISISGLGTIVDVGDDTNIGQRGQAVVEITNGGRLVTDQNIIGDEAAGDGRVTLSDPFSMWRASSTMTVADAGRALLQIFDGARVENTGGIVANLAGATGTVEVDGLGSLWQNSLNLIIGEFGHGTLIVADGGRVTNGGGANQFLVGRQIGSIGQVEVRGLDSVVSVSILDVGDSGDGALRILEGGRVTSGISTLGDNATARGVALVDGVGSRWDISGALDVADLGEGHLTISNGAIVRTSSTTRVNSLGRLTLDGGRLEIDTTTALLSNGVIEGSGTIQGVNLNNNSGGQIRPQGLAPLIFQGTLTNSGLIDVQSAELDVIGSTNNNLDIDARDGAVLRFGGAGLANNSSAQLAITSGIVDVFGAVSNNTGAEIAVGGTAIAVFHDPVMNNGTIFVQPGGEIFTLENLSFTPAATLAVGLRAIDESDPDAEPADGFGQVQVAGAAALAGTLQVSLLGGYQPTAGDSFQLLTAASGLTGTFATELLPTLPGGLDWNVQYNPNSVVLSVIAPLLAGDYNQDGAVDAADYVTWRKDPSAFGGDPAGFNTWRANFGRTAGGGADIDTTSAAVPEPTSFVLLWIAAAVFIFRRHPLIWGSAPSIPNP